MSNSSSSLLHDLILLSNQIREALSRAYDTPPEGSEISIKSTLLSLLPNSSISQNQLKVKIVDFSLCCAALASASNASYDQLSWVPNYLSEKAVSAFGQISNAYYSVFEPNLGGFGELGVDLEVLGNEKKLVIELLPEVLILIKENIKESSIDTSDDADKISAASARVPLVFAVVAAYQLRWFITQIDYPFLGKLCNVIIPCGLTALDHWSPEVKGQGMVCFIHLAKNVNAAEIGVYEDVILDACCQNIAVSDEIWDLAVEMSVLMAASTQGSNPHSEWYEKLLNEMLSHLERQPRDKGRRIAWLKHTEPLLNGIGLVLLAHFRRMFPLFFQWMHADDDDTVLLVLDRIKTIIKLTWMRNSPYLERLVDELVNLYKEAALRIRREDIRTLVLQIIILIQQSKGSQFDISWDKHMNDPDLIALSQSLNRRDTIVLERYLN